jgi:hypothetical protein
MSHTWKLLPLAAIAAIGAVLLLSTLTDTVRPVYANEPQLELIVDTSPSGGIGYELTWDNVNADTNDDCEDLDGTSVILDDGESATMECADNDDPSDEVDVDVTLEVPNHSQLQDVSCEVVDDGDTAGTQSTLDFDDFEDDQANLSFTVTDNEHIECEFDIDFEEDDVTPTVSPTGTAGAARTIVVQSANQQLGCANTTIVTITVRGANGQPVAAGTLVNIQASLGAVSPTSGQTTADGSVFVFYTAPQNQGGTATITATAGSASGQATIAINCAQPTQAPPPTTAPSGGITPPSTGDGGLTGAGGWQTYAGVAMIIASVIGTLVVVRPRASR